MVPEVEDHFASCAFRFNRAKSATARTHAAATFAVAAQSTLKVQSLRLLVVGTLGLSRTNLIVVDVTRRYHNFAFYIRLLGASMSDMEIYRQLLLRGKLFARTGARSNLKAFFAAPRFATTRGTLQHRTLGLC